jgi:hypothetical protein
MITLRAVLNVVVKDTNQTRMPHKISGDTEPMCSLNNESYTEIVGNFYILSICCE